MSKLKTMLSNGGCLGCTGRALLTIEGPYWSLAKRRSFAVMLRDSAFSMGCVRYSCGQMGNRLGRCKLLFVGKKNVSDAGVQNLGLTLTHFELTHFE